MKIISLLFLSLLVGKSCNDESKQDLKTAIIEYTANTRGFYRKIVVEDQAVKIWTERGKTAQPQETKLSEADQKELVEALREIDLDGIPDLKAPTEKRFYDGAAMANLRISYKGKMYESQTFDHGNPPAGIEKLVVKLVSFIKEE